MPNDLYIYTTPAEADVQLTLDSGAVIVGVPCTANGRDDAHRLTVPPHTTGGAELAVTCEGYIAVAYRGLMVPATDGGEAHFQLDDVRLVEVPKPAEEVPRNPDADPLAIIQGIFNLHDHDLSEKDGCGTFTEDCCTALNEQQSADWGHIKKNPGQNQWNGHAVDALMLRWPAGDTQAGIYDIIHDSESANASPSFNYKGEPDPNLWYYPA
jgi:hypothetical protein